MEEGISKLESQAPIGELRPQWFRKRSNSTRAMRSYSGCSSWLPVWCSHSSPCLIHHMYPLGWKILIPVFLGRRPPGSAFLTISQVFWWGPPLGNAAG
jgi:hypothetical protein